MQSQEYEILEEQLIQVAKEIAKINELLERISETAAMKKLEKELDNSK